MFTSIRRTITAGSLLVLTAIMFVLAKYLPVFWFSFYPDVSRRLLSVIGAVFGAFPFCVWELLLVLLLIWGIVSLILSIKGARIVRWLTGVLELAAVLLFLFVGIWGLNHFGPTVAQQLELPVREYTVDELKGATQHYATLASQDATQVQREADGTLRMPPFGELSQQATADFAAMSGPLFTPGATTVKPLLTSRLFSYMGITGIFVDITGEACVNTETYAASLPFTVCHELSHSCAVSAEDDASFCAYLVCAQSSDALFRYSGSYSAFVYCYNALYAADAAAASAIYNACSEPLKQDCKGANTYYEQFEGPAKEVTEKVNDSYLKAFGEKKGVKSYGAVTDMLIAQWLLQQAG